MAGRFIKLYDKILGWEWYHDVNTFRLFVHLLLKANYKDLSFEGRTILRGQLVTSLPQLASQTGLSVRQIRVSLDKLKLTGEVTDKTFNRYRVITVVKYDEYQQNDRQNDRQMTGETAGKRQADDRQMTGKRQADDRQMTASIDNIEYIERVEKIEQIESGGTAKRFTPPTREQIESFCLEHGIQIDADRFIDYYTSNGWMVGRNKMKSWEATVQRWAREDRAPAQGRKTVVAQQYEQRDYSTRQEDILDRQQREFEEMLRRRQG